jgi:hypothetical protein
LILGLVTDNYDIPTALVIQRRVVRFNVKECLEWNYEGSCSRLFGSTTPEFAWEGGRKNMEKPI